ncbi:MAG: DUF1549 domain-containing protein [Gemmataceae bacterium]
MLACFGLLLCFAAAPASATTPQSLAAQIDALIEAQPDFAKHDAGPADDAEFCRRVYLDLTGRLPTAAQTRAFMANKGANKRSDLIDALLASPEHARHLMHQFDVTLMERLADTHVPKADWQAFLFEAFRANRPWDEIAREILSGDDRDAKARHRVKFFLERGAEPNLVTRDVSRLFLGTNLQCAQCHDHPLVEDYKQADYFGLFAFVHRTSLVVDKKTKRPMLSEKADGEVSFQSVFDPKKITRTTAPRVPGGKPLDDPKADPKNLYITAPAAGIAAVPRYSRRAQLAGQIARVDYEPFRRNLSNRLWALLFGQGLIEPLDMDHSDNLAALPELHTAISDELLRNRMNIRETLREIARTRAYQRSSIPKITGEPGQAPFLATAPLKALSPEQMAWSLAEATGLIEMHRLALKEKANEAELYNRVAQQLVGVIRVFANPPGTAASFEARADQALFLANGPTVRAWLAPRAGNLMDRLSKLKGDALADELYLSVLARLPEADERRDLAEALKRQPEGLSEIVWGLLASTEFRFNH